MESTFTKDRNKREYEESDDDTRSFNIVSEVFFRYIMFNVIFESKQWSIPYLKSAPFWDEQTQNACILRLLFKNCFSKYTTPKLYKVSHKKKKIWYCVFNTHQNHQNMRFDLIYCVQKESISPFQLRFPYLKKINKKN